MKLLYRTIVNFKRTDNNMNRCSFSEEYRNTHGLNGFTALPWCDKKQAARSVFTLVELLVVIAIISILACLLLPVLGRAKAVTKSVICCNNQKQLSIGWSMYAVDNNGYIMPMYKYSPTLSNIVPGINPVWFEYMLQEDIIPGGFRPNRNIIRNSAAERLLVCPADSNPFKYIYLIPVYLSYGYNYYMDPQRYLPCTRLTQLDNLSSKTTVIGDTWSIHQILGTQTGSPGITAINNISTLCVGPYRAHPAGMYSAKADGHVDNITYYDKTSGYINIWVSSSANIDSIK